MEDKTKRTVVEVLDMETGECVIANEFFQKDISELTLFRSELNRAIEGFRESLFTCYYCKQKIKIRGGNVPKTQRKENILHFAHLKDSDECHIKTDNKYTKDEVDRIKYNGAKESILHKKIKGNIATFLNSNLETKKEVSNIEVEKIVRNTVSKSWKKPDINAYFLDKRMAIELQLSTTWLSVITQRQEFYKNEGIYIFWVFHSFDENDYQRKLTINDVIYTNYQNAYIFDDETYELSKQANDLILKCYFKTYFRNGIELGEYWENEFIKLSDLTFDSKTFKVFFRDTEQQKKIICQEIDEYIKLPEIVKIRKEQDKEELERNVEKLNYEIEKIRLNRKKEKQKVEDVKYEFQEQSNFVENTIIDTEKVVTYFSFSENRRVQKPFENNESLIRELKKKFGDKLKKATKRLFDAKVDESNLARIILGIDKFNTADILGKTYCILDTTKDWEFIKKNYEQISFVQKEALKYSYGREIIYSVKYEYELSRYQCSRATLLLIDLSTKMREYDDKNLQIQKIIEEESIVILNIILSVKTDINLMIRTFTANKIDSLKVNLRKYEESMEELNSKYEDLKKSLKNNKKKLTKFPTS